MATLRKFLVIFERTKFGFSSYVPDLDGCIATGKTKTDAEKNIYDAIRFHIEGMEEEGLKIPVPKSETK